jgi:hypothetical protein
MTPQPFDESTVLKALLMGLFVVPFMGFVGGAYTVWLVGLFFPQTIAAIGTMMGGLSSWQVGAVLGIVGSFFRPRPFAITR